MMGYYEIIIIYDKDCGDVISFWHNGLVNDENDIVTQAVKKRGFSERKAESMSGGREVYLNMNMPT